MMSMDHMMQIGTGCESHPISGNLDNNGLISRPLRSVSGRRARRKRRSGASAGSVAARARAARRTRRGGRAHGGGVPPLLLRRPGVRGPLRRLRRRELLRQQLRADRLRRLLRERRWMDLVKFAGAIAILMLFILVFFDVICACVQH